jgi:hypothetical protein
MDYITDQNPVNFNELRSKLDEPEYVKSASHQDEGLTDREFAYSSKREFPIDSAGSAYLSKVYYEANKHKLNKLAKVMITTGLEKAAKLYKIEEDFSKIEGAVDNIKSAAPKSMKKFAMQVEKDGKTFNYYNITDKEDTIDSARRLANDFHKMPVDWFRKAAGEIVDRAAEFEVPDYLIPAKVKNAGTKRQVDFNYAERVVEKRAAKVDEDTADLYREIFKSAKADNENLDNYLTLMVDLDRTNGINYGYHEDPFSAFYSSYKEDEIEKLASEHIFIGEVPVPKEVFTKIAEEDIIANFRKEDSEKILDLQKRASTATTSACMGDINALLSETKDSVQRELIQLCLANG